ncbi:MAG: hemolysin III family protein [Planctomycetota bacterium]
MSEPSVTATAEAPVRPDQEWANALSHAIATILSVVAGIYLVGQALSTDRDMAIAVFAYMATVFATFFASTLSHVFLTQPWLNRFRALDQAMIYLMIVGTYTPIAFQFASDSVRAPLITTIWVAALTGAFAKLFLRHRVNAVGTVSYLLLGWLPAIPLVCSVPTALAWGMLLGGVSYSVGVAFLMNDHRMKYMHVIWHFWVMAAATIHFLTILWFVVR